MKIEEEFDARRKEIGLASQFAKFANSGESAAKRMLSDLSEVEQNDFVIRQFIAKEKQEAAVRSFEHDSDIRQAKLETAWEDLNAISGSLTYAPIDWLAIARKTLEANGISTDAPRDAVALQVIADKLRLGALESAWRTERAISGKSYKTNDSYFEAFHSDSALPQIAKGAKTVGHLLREFMADAGARANAGHLAPDRVRHLRGVRANGTQPRQGRVAHRTQHGPFVATGSPSVLPSFHTTAT